MFKNDVDKLKQVQKKAVKIVKALEIKLCEEWLREIGMFSLNKSSL